MNDGYVTSVDATRGCALCSCLYTQCLSRVVCARGGWHDPVHAVPERVPEVGDGGDAGSCSALAGVGEVMMDVWCLI